MYWLRSCIIQLAKLMYYPILALALVITDLKYYSGNLMQSLCMFADFNGIVWLIWDILNMCVHDLGNFVDLFQGSYWLQIGFNSETLLNKNRESCQTSNIEIQWVPSYLWATFSFVIQIVKLILRWERRLVTLSNLIGIQPDEEQSVASIKSIKTLYHRKAHRLKELVYSPRHDW